MTEREYRQDDTTEGYCDCGEPLSNVTVGGRGFCEIHGWRDANWHAPRCPGCHALCTSLDVEHRWDCPYQGRDALPFPANRDPGDETDQERTQP